MGISVIILAGGKRQRVERAITSVLGQADLHELAELVVIDFAAGTAPALSAAGHALVEIRCEPALRSLGDVRAEAVAVARGQVIAFLEEHAVAAPGWLAGIAAVFRENDKCGAVCGEVRNANPGSAVSEAIAIMNYSRWLPPVSFNPDADIVVGHNCAYRKAALEGFGDDLGRMLEAEPLLQWELRKRGWRLQVDPRVAAAHQNEYRIPDICRGYFHWNRCFGYARASYNHWTWGHRALRAAATPLVPVVRMVKMARACRQGRRVAAADFIKALPAMLIAQSAASLGQTAGYLFGEGGAPIGLAECELNLDRGPVSHLEMR
jgi:glycosyltransferase involved in cell wall biosynthesis